MHPDQIRAVPDPTSALHVTVVVCTRDRTCLLEACIAALRMQSYPEFDVLVVDNGSDAATRELCARLGVSWIAAPVPGLTRARNIGARAARGDLIAYIDDDALAEPGWLRALVEPFAAPGVGAVSGRVRYMRALPGSRGMTTQEAGQSCARGRASFDMCTSGWFALACFGGVGDGGNMVFRRALIADGAGFDERIGRGRLLDSGDEHVVFAQLIALGARVVHAPEAVVRHPSPPTAALQAARRFSDLRSSISHLLFVLGEFPAHRLDVLRFLLRAVHRRVARRTAVAQQSGPGAQSRWQATRAIAAGLRLYLRARAEWPGGREARADAPAFMESTPTSR